MNLSKESRGFALTLGLAYTSEGVNRGSMGVGAKLGVFVSIKWYEVEGASPF